MNRCLPDARGASWLVPPLVLAWLAACAAPPDDFVPCELQADPRFDVGLYAHVFEQITAEIDGRPAYMSWPLFPLPPRFPPEELVFLGLPVHGRWATTRVNPIAEQALAAYSPAAEASSRAPLVLPPGSVIVKQNFSSRFPSGGAPPVEVAFEEPVLRVLTVMYKPTEAERREFDFTCATAGLEPYNGDPESGCLGGEWFWAFYKLESDDQTETNPRGCDTTPLGRWLNTEVNESAGSFCIHCHSPAFATDYSRILWDNVVRGAVEPGPPPQVQPASPPSCSAVLSPDPPADVPIDPLAVWEGEGGETAAKSMFDCFSWQTFVALSWPAESPGRPDRSKTVGDPGDPVWQTYMPVYATFQPGDLDWRPPPFGERPVVDARGCEPGPGQMVLSLASKARDVVNETGQAFAGTFGNLVDRNGHEVRYEVLIDETEYDYVVGNGFADTSRLTPGGPAGSRVDFPDGSIEVKSAWKRLCTEAGCLPVDDPSEYVTTGALIYDSATRSCSGPVEMGLVALHLAIKTFWAPQWVWATFSNVHNAPIATEPAQLASDAFSFYDPALAPPPDALPCAIAPFLLSPAGCPNVVINRFGDRPGGLPPFLPPPDQPNQITRLVPPDAAADEVNALFREALAGTPLEHYVLLDAQWPLHGQAGTPAEPRPVMKECEQKADGGLELGDNCFAIVPPVLRNPVVESYMTTYRPADGHPVQVSNRSCLNCHFLGAQGSFIWLDATANRVPVKPARAP